MAEIIEHRPPTHSQDDPADLTFDTIDGQVIESELYSRPLSTRVAREVASWWADREYPFGDFATTGTISDALFDEIDRMRGHVERYGKPFWPTEHTQQGYTEGDGWTADFYRRALQALRRYVGLSIRTPVA